MRNGQFKDAKETDAHVKPADGTSHLRFMSYVWEQRAFTD